MASEECMPSLILPLSHGCYFEQRMSVVTTFKPTSSAMEKQSSGAVAWRLFLFFLAGCVLGCVFDGLHANYEILAYNEPDIGVFKQAWWVPPLFGSGGLLLGLAPWLLPRVVLSSFAATPLLKHKQAGVAWLQLGSALVVYGLSSLVPYHTPLGSASVSALLGALFLGTWVLTNGRAAALAVCLVVGGCGAVWEATLCAYGWFRYISPDPLGAHLVSHWIFWIWAAAALAGIHLSLLYVDAATTSQEPQYHPKAKDPRGKAEYVSN